MLLPTSSSAFRHHCSNSCKPIFRYSPLLNEQHSRRSNKLPENKICKSTYLVIKCSYLCPIDYIYSVPVKELHIDVRENLMEEFSGDHRWDLEIIKTRQETGEENLSLQWKSLKMHSLTWFSAIKVKVCSSLLIMFCHCTYDACCLEIVVKWMFLVTSRKVLALVGLGACYISHNTVLTYMISKLLR